MHKTKRAKDKEKVKKADEHRWYEMPRPDIVMPTLASDGLISYGELKKNNADKQVVDYWSRGVLGKKAERDDWAPTEFKELPVASAWSTESLDRLGLCGFRGAAKDRWRG